MNIYEEIKGRINEKGKIIYKREDYQYEINYKDFFELIDKVASSMLNLGIKKGDKIGIYLPTSPEWIVIDLACFKIGAISVPISSKLKKEKLREFLNFIEIDKIFSLQDYDFLENKIIIKNFSDIYSSFESLIKEDKIDKYNYKVNEEDTATICYTSGSTGTPKGVILSHSNILFNLRNIPLQFNERDLFLHYLPLEHIFGRTCGIYMAMYNSSNIFILEDPKKIFIEMFKIKPSIVMTVPLILEKFYNNLISDEVLRDLINKKNYAPVKSNLYSKLGNQFRFFLSGGAPLNIELQKVFRNLGIEIYEGYGLTETAPLISSNFPEKYQIGSVGVPIRDTEIKISEKGTLLVKSPGLMKGYTDYEQTKKLIKDGWFDTNDIVEIDEKGFIKILGRADDLIVLSNGKKIFPEKIEKELENIGLEQVIIMRSEGNNLIALIYTDKDKFSVKEIIQKYNLQCPGFEKIKDYVLLPEEMTIDNDLLTVTLKKRRKEVLRRYQRLIEAVK